MGQWFHRARFQFFIAAVNFLVRKFVSRRRQRLEQTNNQPGPHSFRQRQRAIFHLFDVHAHKVANFVYAGKNAELRFSLCRAKFAAMALPSEEEIQAMKSQSPDCAKDRLASLPHILTEADSGMKEALRRKAELEQDSSVGMTLEELRASVRTT